ncbi:MAG TPA: hypothetical protein VK824_02565, partial [Planctomycetota bacterium]|nr:hypothetical protein [Planctomycetota bacterium]
FNCAEGPDRTLLATRPPGIAMQLESALAETPSGELVRSERHSSVKEAIVIDGPLSAAELGRRARTVAGWEQIAVVGSWDPARSIADDPALTSEAVRRIVREPFGPPYADLKEVLVDCGGDVVSRFTIEAGGADFWSCVIGRGP